MRAKIFIPSKAAVFEKFAPPAGRKGVMGGGGQDTKYSQSKLQGNIPGDTFGTCRLSSYRVISEEKVGKWPELYQNVLGIQLAFQNVLFHYKIMRIF